MMLIQPFAQSTYKNVLTANLLGVNYESINRDTGSKNQKIIAQELKGIMKRVKW